MSEQVTYESGHHPPEGHGHEGHGIHLPAPTAWPAFMAFAVSMFTAGLIVNTYFSFAALIIFAISLIGWIGDLLHA